ncbi:MAG TPA: NmrA/HSCARG family protein [bacterium]|nr:NmrA/HSCARG family protein [bacterium]
MDPTSKIILVTGSTGQQGGAVARHLLAGNWRLRALVRDPLKPAAQALAHQGVELVTGDFNDPVSLDQALRGVYGVFSVQNFWLPDVGRVGEVRQGKNLADAARTARVEHFIYTSVGSANRDTGIPHFESKWEIEQHIHRLGLPATIFRPVTFMDNYTWQRPQILNGNVSGSGLRPDRTNQYIAVHDIGWFVRRAFEDPEGYIGKSIDLAGDQLTEPQVAEVFSTVIGRPVRLTEPQGRWSNNPEAERCAAG